jgi:hypothetical protein
MTTQQALIAALQWRIDHAQILITPTWPCYGRDSDNRPWCTFSLFNHTIPCAVCGATISGGWQCGRFGEPIQSVCSKHIKYEVSDATH